MVIGGSGPSVGPGGWTAGGGHSPVTRTLGLGVDNVLEIEMVAADGSVVTVRDGGQFAPRASSTGCVLLQCVIELCCSTQRRHTPTITCAQQLRSECIRRPRVFNWFVFLFSSTRWHHPPHRPRHHHLDTAQRQQRPLVGAERGRRRRLRHRDGDHDEAARPAPWRDGDRVLRRAHPVVSRPELALRRSCKGGKQRFLNAFRVMISPMHRNTFVKMHT